MNDLIPQSALRDLRAHLAAPRVAIVMAGVAIVLGLSGPFDTFAAQSLPVRMLYWALVVWLTYGAGCLVSLLLAPHLDHRPFALRVMALGIATALVVFLVLYGLNLLFGLRPTALPGAGPSFGAIFVICLVVHIAAQVMESAATIPPTPSTPASNPMAQPALLQRLPLQKRGDLLSLSVQDHYVDVVTSKGREMLLMRLGDAMRETAPLAGMQVHRSHWVAHAAITSVSRRGDGAMLTLVNGSTLPVSRAFVPALRQAGLLPHKGS